MKQTPQSYADLKKEFGSFINDIALKNNLSTETSLTEKAEIEHLNDIKSDRKLKEWYANILIWTMVVQLVVVNAIFVLNGRGYLVFNNITLNIFIGGTFVEICAIVAIIVKGLFSNRIRL
ncbi:MAG: hypothetical protein LBG21_04240 [Campylobacteraceae bacterium]|jgi:hypothetical protein|nr:hypothetical protein [Campylobacteraceae bacterium]